MDVMTRKQRSYNMSRIRGKWTSIDREVHNWLKGMKITHRMYPRVIGNPDIEIRHNSDSLFVFLDGCFWHCCPLHYRRPKSRLSFWIPHIEESDKRREMRRKRLPYRWIRIWEHEVNDGRFSVELDLFIKNVR